MPFKLNSSLVSSLALIFGITASFLPYPFIFHTADFVTEIFLNFLQLLSMPIIFLSIIATISKMNNVKEAGLLVKKILKYTLFTTVGAAFIGSLLFLLIKPYKIAQNITYELAASPLETYLTFVKSIIPSNFAEAFLHNNVLGIAFIATILGIAILQLDIPQKSTVKDFFQALFQALLKISSSIIFLLPFGVFFFSIKLGQTLQSNANDLRSLILYATCVISANLIQGFVLLPLFLKRKGISPLKLMKATLPALATAFFTKSSSATLPISLDCMKKRFKASEKTTDFGLPLCSIINMNGCAAFILITVLFVSSSYGITYNFFQTIPWILIATLAAIGNAGVPMGCYFLTSALLVGMKLPLSLLGMILPLYAFFDMVETALNVWSDCCVTAVVDKEVRQEKEKKIAPSF